MMNRHLARTLVILAVAALPVVGLASPADAKPVNSVKALKSSCAKGNGSYFQSNDGTVGVCLVKGGDVTCDDTKTGNKCTSTTARMLNQHERLLLKVLLDTSQPTTGANPGGSGSTNTPGTNTPGTKPTGTTTTTTTKGTTTTKPPPM